MNINIIFNVQSNYLIHNPLLAGISRRQPFVLAVAKNEKLWWQGSTYVGGISTRRVSFRSWGIRSGGSKEN
ncbi:protein of unknown function [Xenorhabdus nematophila AN6/1]|nr:protein of unknown function [Xenorhabdus nematophila AN6/1]